MARKRFSEEEIRWIDKEEKLRYGRFSGIVTEFEGKRVVVGTVVDITEMREYEEKLRDEQKLLEKTLEGTIHAIVEIVETKDPYTAGHQVRVSKLSVAIAKKMDLENIREILWASLLHDVGKISVPDDILVLPRKLTPIEFEIVKTHSITGYNIVKVIQGMEKVAEIILQHHERIDGTGYPKGLKGEEILKEARIIGVSDVVEAMVNHRPYRPALSLNDALEEIYKNRGIKYDKEVVEVCIELFLSRKFSFEEPF
jgi:putative nucleotidyltransferase with HDIG domain